MEMYKTLKQWQENLLRDWRDLEFVPCKKMNYDQIMSSLSKEILVSIDPTDETAPWVVRYGDQEHRFRELEIRVPTRTHGYFIKCVGYIEFNPLDGKLGIISSPGMPRKWS